MNKFILLFLTLFTLQLHAQQMHVTLSPNNTVVIRNEINEETVSKAQKELADLVEKRGTKTYKIFLVLDSPGGSIDAGLNFIEFAKIYPNVDTITIFAASMASAIVQSLPGKRLIIPTGAQMFHRARGGVSGQFETGELETRLEFYKRLVLSMEMTNANRMGLSISSYKALVKDELWILGFDSVSKKASDHIISLSCTTELIKNETVETFLFMGMIPIKVAFSGCPLIRSGVAKDPNNQERYNTFRAEKWKIKPVN